MTLKMSCDGPKGKDFIQEQNRLKTPIYCYGKISILKFPECLVMPTSIPWNILEHPISSFI